MKTPKKTYYAVCSSFYNDGRVVANLTDTVQSDTKPEDTHKETRRCDIYVNWFESLEEANKYIKECKQA